MSKDLTTQPTNKQLQNTTKAEMVQSAFSAKAMTKEQMNIIRTQIAPDITDADLMYCLEIADNCQLNPILKDIYFVPRMAQINGRWVTKHEPMVGRKGARSIARRKGMIVPPNTGHTIKQFPKLVNGKWTMEQDLIGYAELVIAGQVVRKEAAYSVYKQTKKDGTVSKFWNDMPTVMVEKVAEFQLLDAVYGLDGVMSMDAGLLGEDDLSSNLSLAASKYLTADIEASVLQLGLNISKEDGIASIIGATFGKDSTLKGIGFFYNNGKWQMNCQNEVIIEAHIEDAPKRQSVASELTSFLSGNGMNKTDIGVFVKQVLRVSSKDEDAIELILSNKELLVTKMKEFLTPTALPEVDADASLFDDKK